MGQTLSVPATEKKTETGNDERYAYGVSEMQGWRISMEDAHTIVLKVEPDKPEGDHAFFAVYDGHGGAAAAKFAGQNVHKRLLGEASYREKRWADALKDAFLGADEDMRADPMFTRDPSGCTAVAALITADRKLLVANAGDSRSVISVQGEVKPMSYDHKPQSETEKARISAAGGYVEYGRVNGNLALSRALGDFEYKKNSALSPEAQIITANPDIIEHQLTDEDEFLVLACDGIWDCLSSQQVVDVVRRKVADGTPLGEIAEQICDLCLAPDTTSGAGIGCDNMTIMVVAILNGRTPEEWYSWIGDRVRRNHGYCTPQQLPQIFAQSRILAFQARQKAQKEREDRDRQEGRSGSGAGMGGALGVGGLSALGGFARVLSSTGGISFHPGSGVISDTGSLMFGNYNEEEEDSDEEMDSDGADADADGQAFFNDSFGTGAGNAGSTKSLRAQLAELEDSSEDEEMEEEKIENTDGKGVKHVPPPTRTETPPPPAPPSGPIGSEPVAQLQTQPGGDAPSPAVKAEGLLDKSEDPLKA